MYYDKNKRRANSFVKLSRNDSFGYGQIIYLVKKTTGEIDCLIKSFDVQNDQLFFYFTSMHIFKHLLPDQEKYSGKK